MNILLAILAGVVILVVGVGWIVYSTLNTAVENFHLAVPF